MEVSGVDDVAVTIHISPLGWCLIALVALAVFVLILRPFAGRDDQRR